MTVVLRLLTLLPFAPRLDAAHGGGRVVSQFLDGMMSRHEVAVVCLRGVDEPATGESFLRGCEVIEEVVRPSPTDLSRAMRVGRRAASLMRLRPAWVEDWRSDTFGPAARMIARGFQPDVIQVEGHVMGQYVPSLGDVAARRLLVQHEPAARAAPYFTDIPRYARRPVEALERIAWSRYETALYRRVDAIVVFTDADRRIVRRHAGSTPVHVIPPGTVVPEHPLDPAGRPPPTLVFVGNFIHPPNVDAARRLARSIFPQVRRQIPECRLLIVGEAPPPDLLEAQDERLVVTGRVPAVIPYLEEAALFVAPLRLGGGIRIKVMEALAAGKAVVATPLAIQGLDVHGHGVVEVADDEDGFVESVVRLLRDENERASLARRARRWAVDQLGWDGTIAQFERLYEDLVTSPGPPSEGGAFR